MQNILINYMNNLIRSTARRRRLQLVISTLSLAVVAAVFWQLRIVGISMTDEALCGYQDHTHTAECLTTKLICGLEASEGHTHSDICHGIETVMVCAKEVHTHSDDCLKTRVQLCSTPEHTHSDDCFKTEKTLICDRTTEEHKHGDGCYKSETVPVCSKTTEEHKHGSDCYKPKTVLVCKDTSEGHTHGTDCYKPEKVLICEDTSEEHKHGDICYKVDKVLACDKTTEEHKHGDSCYKTENVLICEKTTDEHNHGDDCYETSTLQVCEKEVHTHTEDVCFALVPSDCAKEVHEHSDSCFQDQDKLVCGQKEHAAHSHTAECEREAYGCGFEKEHTHTLLCYSDTKADLETASDWESTLPALIGDPAKDLVAVASSQVGYAESQANYKVDQNETAKHGYTRYGEWYGNPYGNWDTMFVSFCLKYSNHPDYAALKNSGAEAMRQAAISAGKYTAVAPDLLPAAGSVVFLDKNSNGSADSTAIVTYAGNGVIAVVMGDLDGAVGEAQYAMNNGIIMGYALLPSRVNPPSFAAAPRTEDIPGETSGDEPESQADGITVTFVINNSAYTSDNGYTHVKIHGAEDPTTRGFISEPGGITYEKWDSQDMYRVRGTGTLMRYTIPAGTSLSGNGYSGPNIAYNEEGGSVAYRSAFNWVTDAGMICRDNTVFTTDTVLYLYMYETDTGCTLNYVCNCSSGGSHGIVDIVSGFGEPLFSWGQSIDAAYIPTAEAVNSQYTGSQSYTAGPDHGMTFKEWYVIDSTTKTEVPFTAGMPLLERYEDPNASRNVRIYARWEDAPVSVTATFVNGAESSTVTLNKGDALGTNLPAAPDAPENKIFVGWQIGDTGEYATEETQITANTTYIAVFADKVTVTFKNGEETVEIRDLAVNSPVGELPTATGAMGQTLLGWVLEGSAEGSTDYLTPETVITQSNTYVPVFAETATITFMNGTTQFGSTVSDVPIGAKLWLYLPEEVPEGYIDDEGIEWIFEGWQINGQDQLVDETSVVPAGLENNALVLNAVFREFAGWNVYFHDIDPDGNEYTDENVESIDWLIPDGETVADWYGEETLNSDGAFVQDCLWFYKDGDGHPQEFELSTPVTSELHLYTYSYRLVLMKQAPTQTSSLLNLFPVASAAHLDISEDGNTFTLTLRQGEKPKASDFIVNGEDYTLYNWIDQETNKDLNLAIILAKGVAKNITAVANGKLQPSTTRNIWFFVYINEERVKVTDEDVPYYRFGNRYYISAAKLEQLYGKYGFTADMLKPGTKYFPHAGSGQEIPTLWCNADVVEHNGMYFSPVLEDDANADVFYTPHETVPSSGGHPYTDFTKTDTFYTFEVNDPAGIYYDPGELNVLDYVLTGTSHTITLPYDPLAPWHASKRILATGKVVEMDPEQDNFTVDIDEDNGTATYTFHSVVCPIVMQPYREGEVQIIYNTNVTGTVLGSTPTVNGLTEYSDTVQLLAGDVYIVNTPSKLQYSVRHYGALNTYVFEGWMVNGSQTDLLQPGDELVKSDFLIYSNTLELTAKWGNLPKEKKVSFFVNLQMVQEGQTDTSTDSGNYTEGLYGAKLLIEPTPTISGDITVYGDDLSRTGEINAAIRKMTSIPLPADFTNDGVDNPEHTASLTTFPNDEQMLESIRSIQEGYIASFQQHADYDPDDPTNVTAYRSHGSYNGRGQFVYTYQIICEPKYTDDGQVELHYIPANELTPEHFTIHWYVLKYDGTNGWHIDGVLVKKQAYITVNKVFYGDQEVIDSITDNFNITVTNTATGEEVCKLVTRDPAEGEAAIKYDYQSSDKKTYTWVVPLNAGTKYTLQEDGCECERSDIAAIAEVQLDNPAPGSDEIIGRQPYSSTGVTVKAKSYNANVNYTGYQTVTFYNSYLPIEALPISKLDDSGYPVPGVSFRLMQDGNPLDILIDTAGTYYVSRGEGNDGHIPEDAEPVTSGRITVSDQGYAQVKGLLGGVSYTLVEDFTPKGYIPAPDINFTFDETTGIITLNGDYGSDITTPNGIALRIVNNSVKMNVRVTKEWLDGTDQEVTVKLTRGGMPLDYGELTLNAENNWTGTWENISAYVGGSLAQYSVQETRIGNTSYISTIPGGFQNYIVSVSAPAYTYNDNDLPTEAAFTVTNSVRTGALQFTKVDGDGNGLAGAGFQLFKVASCTEESAFGFGVISNIHGIVSFGDLPVGTYYMKEMRTPAGYKKNETVYLISVTADGATIADKYTLSETDGSILSIDSVITDNTIVNLPETADLKVRKVRRVVNGEDATFAPLEGASFEVYLLDGVNRIKISRTIDETPYNAFTSGSDGYLTVPDLLLGNYELVETHAPVGFYRRTEPISFNVAYGAISADDDSANNGWHIEEVTDPDTGDVTVCIVVENDPGSELPHTGGMGTHYGTMAGLLMMAASLYAILLRRKREGRAV